MSKSNISQKALRKLSEILNRIQDRTIWLTTEFRTLANSVTTLQDRVRLNRGEYNEFVEKADAAVLELQKAHNRLRFDFDQHRISGVSIPVAELKKDIFAVTESLTRVSELAAVSVAQQVPLRKMVETQQAEIDRLRTLAASRADHAIAKYNELESKVMHALQSFNERTSKIEGVCNNTYVNTRFQNIWEALTELMKNTEKRLVALEQPREIRLLVAPVCNPEPTTSINPNAATRLAGYGESGVSSGPVSHS